MNTVQHVYSRISSTFAVLALFNGGLAIAVSLLRRLAARARLSRATAAPLMKLPDAGC